MNKKLLVVGIVILLVAAVYLIDRGTRGAARPAAGSPASASAKPVENTPAPDVTMKDLSGKDVSLSDFRGKVVLVNFWATWCGPCRFEIPSLIEFQQKYADRGFVVLGVAMDVGSAAPVARFLSEYRITYPVAMAEPSIVRNFGGAQFLPNSFLIDRQGRIRNEVRGYYDAGLLDRQIQELLGEPLMTSSADIGPE